MTQTDSGRPGAGPSIATGADGERSLLPPHNGAAAAGQADGHQPARADNLPPDLFAAALRDAELLLLYGSEIGIDIDDGTRNAVLEARAAGSGPWAAATAAKLLAAESKLAAKLKPVTAASLKTCSGDAKRAVRVYWVVAISLAVFLVPASLATFVTSAISSNIVKDIATANALAVKLGSELENPESKSEKSGMPTGLSRIDVTTDLQAFATTMRGINTRAEQLDWFIFRVEKDPYENWRTGAPEIKKLLQLPVPLPPQLDDAFRPLVTPYQDVRSYGQAVVDDVSVFYGALTSCILPVLYALLGTCAFLLRSFEQEVGNRTFTPSHADTPRFLIAGIGGAVVGLFNNLVVSQSISIPPLAIAFLVGYAVDVFFSFLEGLIQVFTKKSAGDGNAPSHAPSGPA